MLMRPQLHLIYEKMHFYQLVFSATLQSTPVFMNSQGTGQKSSQEPEFIKTDVHFYELFESPTPVFINFIISIFNANTERSRIHSEISDDSYADIEEIYSKSLKNDPKYLKRLATA